MPVSRSEEERLNELLSEIEDLSDKVVSRARNRKGKTKSPTDGYNLKRLSQTRLAFSSLVDPEDKLLESKDTEAEDAA